MSAQTGDANIDNLLAMHPFSIDLPTEVAGLRHTASRVTPALAPATREAAAVGFGAVANSRGFVTMLSDYHASVGLARGNSLGHLLDHWQCGNFISLARLIAADEIFSFNWRAETWIPMFQFDLRDLSVKPGLRRILAELKPVFNDWELAVWFLQCNPSLESARPVDLVDSDLAGVLQAARADRFIAAG